MNELFWEATQSDRMAGYCRAEDEYICLFCDFKTEEGYIFKREEGLVDAKKQMMLHIEEVHGGVLSYLTSLDKKVSGLSVQQSSILRMFYEGLSDHNIQKQLAIGSISTVRNHRHALKEKEKQVKTMATIFDLLAQNTDEKKMPVRPHPTATLLDDRYNITSEDKDKVIEKYFPDGPEGRLTTFYVKEKFKIVILGQIIRHFERVRRYREKEVDVILQSVYPEDYVLIRRYLIQYGFLDRERDGSYYWVKEAGEAKNKEVQKDQVRKKALKKAYKEKVAKEVIESGVYQIRNMFNGKIYLGTARDIHKLEGIKFQLATRSFPNSSLQEDWLALGEENFAIEVLESFPEGKDYEEVSKKLSELKEKWKEALEPYGDKGYHRKSRRS